MNDLENFELLKQAIFAKCPSLEKILMTSGDQSLSLYAKSYKENATQIDPLIKQEFIAEIKGNVESLLGTDVAESVGNQLLDYYYVSTTDHHGPLSHPFFIHADLLAGMKQEGDTTHENLIILACSNVSLGNSSLPRSLVFHHKNQSTDEYGKINLFPASDRPSPVFRFRPFASSDLKRIQYEIEVKYLNGTYGEKLKSTLLSLIENIYNTKAVLTARTFADQITITNFYLWRELFAKKQGKLLDLIYLEQEKIVTNLLVKHHLLSDTDVHKFIFDSNILDKIEQLFDGIPGAFSSKGDKGTFLFWYFPQGSKRRIALRREGRELVSADGAYRILLEPENIKTLVEQMELIPSTMLSLSILHCYYGVKCLGGFSQVNYLAHIEKAWNKIFHEDCFDESMEKSPLQALCGDFIVGLLQAKERLLPATTLDFILYESAETFDIFKKTTETVTVAESMMLVFPELYAILYTPEERRANVEKINRDTIFELLKLKKKMLPCIIQDTL